MRTSRDSRFGFRRAVTATVIAALVIVMAPAGHAFPSSGRSVPHASDVNVDGWVWPLAGFRLDRPFVAPAHRYGPGHRGVDLQAMGGLDVRAPAAGTVAFAGQVAGRGVLTIDHGDGLVTTLEPIQTTLLPGAAVARSEWVGIVGVGGHASPGSLHFGVRLHGEYVNPMLLLGEVPRAVLLPCC
ncbi:M23 family metallopeptidase [Microbacterium sp. HD4P20]|uniref:murein hydrolase activator EnvC family protein n=1 Tax=Microbacterium sp. HD4P20 TaxID=2864874 RepID=UPI0020A5321F|nr:M23 family metallopeptidase [Microbacterium sp. HD4P20]MCP2636697.1 M23 family metallopeptidase [Microbacterium sp. HD4P20]